MRQVILDTVWQPFSANDLAPKPPTPQPTSAQTTDSNATGVAVAIVVVILFGCCLVIICVCVSFPGIVGQTATPPAQQPEEARTFARPDRRTTLRLDLSPRQSTTTSTTTTTTAYRRVGTTGGEIRRRKPLDPDALEF